MRVAARVIALLLWSFPPAAAPAQVITVVVRDSATAQPLGDVLVSLMDTTAELLAARRTASDGRVTFRTATSAYHALRAQRLGWRQLVSPWIPVLSNDTLEITLRLVQLPVALSPVIIAAQQDSISRLLPLGIHPKSFAGRIIVPAVVGAHAAAARDYVDIIGSVGVAGLITNTWLDQYQRERRCIGSSRSLSRRSCVAVYVNNVRTDAEQAIDLATPDRLHFAIWLPAVDAGVLYGTDSMDGVLLLFTKDYTLSR